jgi:hypothetical protein
MSFVNVAPSDLIFVYYINIHIYIYINIYRFKLGVRV